MSETPAAVTLKQYNQAIDEILLSTDLDTERAEDLLSMVLKALKIDLQV